VSDARREPAFNWRLNLTGNLVAVFGMVFAFGLTTPFIPLFIHSDLGVANPRQVAFMAGIVTFAGSTAGALSSPMWGWLGDRYGRRSMVLRAMGMSVPALAAAAFVPSVAWLVVVRALQGVNSGATASSTALVADGTPRERMAFALGLISSVFAVGTATGPLVGALLASHLSVRALFLAGGVVLAVMFVPAFIVIRDIPAHQQSAERLSVRNALRAVPKDSQRTVALAMGGVLVANAVAIGNQQLILIKLLELSPAKAAFGTGTAFAAFGLATAAGALVVSRIVAAIGYRSTVAVGAAGLGLAVLGAAAVGYVPLLIAFAAFAGFTFGVLTPALSSVIGLESPSAVRATMFGLSSSAQRLGTGVGPVFGGSIAGLAGAGAGLLALAVLALLMGLVQISVGREPGTASQDPS
jgi:DHA1 family multidrug resistance protein-like MFS transporter